MQNRVVQLFRFLALTFLGGLLILLRYLIKTPQPLASMLPGKDTTYKWTHGHIFYKTLGDVDAPPLLMLHTPAIGSSGYEMRSIIEDLAQHYHIYVPDLLGFGLSDHPHIDYSADIYVALFQDFLRDVIQQPAILLASGLSCNYVIAVASEAPELCQQVLLLSPQTVKQHPWLARAMRIPLPEIFLYALLTPGYMLRRIIAWQYAFDQKHLSNTDFHYYFAAAHQTGAQDAALAFLRGRLDIDSLQLFQTLQVPVLVLWNPHRPHSVEYVSQPQNVSIPIQMVSLSGTSLHVHEEMPLQVVAHILQWSALQVPATSEKRTAREKSPLLGMNHRVTPLVENSQPTQVMNSQPAHQSTTGMDDLNQKERVDAYCVKCKQKRLIQEAQKITTKNGRRALQGVCPHCGTRLFRFIAG